MLVYKIAFWANTVLQFESEIAAHYFVSALMGILTWWVEKDMPCTAEEIDRLFRQLAVPGFTHILAGNHER